MHPNSISDIFGKKSTSVKVTISRSVKAQKIQKRNRFPDAILSAIASSLPLDSEDCAYVSGYQLSPDWGIWATEVAEFRRSRGGGITIRVSVVRNRVEALRPLPKRKVWIVPKDPRFTSDGHSIKHALQFGREIYGKVRDLESAATTGLSISLTGDIRIPPAIANPPRISSRLHLYLPIRMKFLPRTGCWELNGRRYSFRQLRQSYPEASGIAWDFLMTRSAKMKAKLLAELLAN